MPWARFDDQFHDNGKILTFSHRAFRLYVCAITYAARHSTGGKLSATQAQALARQQGLTAREIRELVDKRGWQADAGGYQIHDFHIYNPTDPTAADRARRYRERHGGQNDGENAVTQRDEKRDASVTPSRSPSRPVPVPVPNPSRTQSQPVHDPPAEPIAVGRNGAAHTVGAPAAALDPPELREADYAANLLMGVGYDVAEVLGETEQGDRWGKLLTGLWEATPTVPQMDFARLVTRVVETMRRTKPNDPRRYFTRTITKLAKEAS